MFGVARDTALQLQYPEHLPIDASGLVSVCCTYMHMTACWHSCSVCSGVCYQVRVKQKYDCCRSSNVPSPALRCIVAGTVLSASLVFASARALAACNVASTHYSSMFLMQWRLMQNKKTREFKHRYRHVFPTRRCPERPRQPNKHLTLITIVSN